jgi:hypothetical protein
MIVKMKNNLKNISPEFELFAVSFSYNNLFSACSELLVRRRHTGESRIWFGTGTGIQCSNSAGNTGFRLSPE